MNIGLFAARTVGVEVAKFFGENKEPLACLVLDGNDTSELNQRIIAISGCVRERVFYSNSLYTDETIAALSAFKLDLILLAWWPYIIKGKVLRLARLGCLNFHPSYLPHNRGKHYNFWTIVEDTPFGVTLHWVDEGVDSGDIAFQSPIEKTWEDTGETLYYKAQDEILRLFKGKFASIKRGEIPRIPQDLGQGSYHQARELELTSHIELNKSYRAKDLLNLLRARTFRPHPGVWFVENGVKYEVRIEISKVSDDHRNE